MPLVSVLLPVWNSLPHLDAALASLERQTFRDFEVVAVDDGSTDGSADRLERLAARWRWLRPVLAPHRGLPITLAAAHAAASGALLARHDADDLSHRERLATQVEHLAAHASDALVGSRFRLFPSGAASPALRRWARWHNGLLDHDAIAHESLVDSTLLHGTALFRREWIERAGGWREDGGPEDVDLNLRLLRAGARFVKLPRTLYLWRQHDRNATRCDPRYGREPFARLKLEALLEFVRDGAPTCSSASDARSPTGARGSAAAAFRSRRTPLGVRTRSTASRRRSCSCSACPRCGRAGASASPRVAGPKAGNSYSYPEIRR